MLKIWDNNTLFKINTSGKDKIYTSDHETIINSDGYAKSDNFVNGMTETDFVSVLPDQIFVIY